MMRSSFSAFSCAFTVFLLSSPTVVDGMFMDMYNKLFQAELLDDCSVYVYDRVLFHGAREDWCKLRKSSLTAVMVEENRKNNMYVALIAYFADEDNIVKMSMLYTNGDMSEYELISQKFFEAVEEQTYENPHENTDIEFKKTKYGRYYSMGFVLGKQEWSIVYEACKYGKTKSSGLATQIDYEDDEASVNHIEDCDSTIMTNYPFVTNEMDVYVQVSIDRRRPYERLCEVRWKEHRQKKTKYLDKFILRPIKQSIQTCALTYSMVPDFKKSFPLPYATRIDDVTLNFIGAEKSRGSIMFNGKKYLRPTIEENYSEQPFFFYDATNNKYSPLFLYYKFKGTDRRFTVRFVYEGVFYDIFEPMEYMDECKFTTQDTVAAAPRVLRQDEISISIEVYFLINNIQFQFCVFDVEFTYNGAQYNVNLKLTSEINAYVHVEHRSTTAANCDYDDRTVRWLLAYSSDNTDAELVSLDNDVSSPIFQCSHCGPESKMYCDVSPDAQNYHSAMFILTAEDGKTKITYVRVISGKGYEKKVEYYTAESDKEYYFLQNLDLKLEIREIYVRLEEGKEKDNALKVIPKPGQSDRPKVTQELDKPDSPDKPNNDDNKPDVSVVATTKNSDEGDEDENDENLQDSRQNSHSPYWWLIFLAFFFFV